MSTFVGIDLGTTFSAVAYINSNGKAEAIPNEQNSLLTPSVVDLRSNPPLVGDEAKEKQSLGDEGVYSFFKRDMGNPNALYIENNKKYTPVNLSSFVLRYLKNCAETFLRQPVTDAVITVPAYFNNMQRQATIEAGKQAGLNVLRIINEPTAAAYAYGVRPTNTQSNILVYDLGGGTFDVSLVEITPAELRVIATSGDHMLGGKDWDDRILQYLAAEFKQEFGAELIGEEFNELMVLAEKTKISLSAKQSVKVTVKGNGYSGSYEIKRSQFEELTRDLMERTQMLVNQVLEDAKFTWKDIEGVVLVGGSTRMPMVRSYVEAMSGKPALGGVNPDEAVALGAAIQAAMDIEQGSQPIIKLAGRKKSSDVMSHSLGMIAQNEDGTKYVNSIIIQKNQLIPCQQTRPYQLRVRRSGENWLEVFMTQGETTDPLSCAYLGKYVFTEIPYTEGKTVVIDITYAYDVNGVVNVAAVERSTQQNLKLTVEPLPHDIPERFCLPLVTETRREHLNLYMAFDLSGSMTGEPLIEAKKAAEGFVNECDVTNTSIGIIEFSDKTLITARASQNVNKIIRGIDNLYIGRTGYGNETHPFDEIFRHLKEAKGLRYALVLTDGVWKNQPEAIRAAKRCHQAGIEIIAVGFGEADKYFLREISSSEELSFFTSLGDLSETFSAIAQELTESGGQFDGITRRRTGLKLFI
ncbi:Hsp70 family protein [Aetokthonos hydrillicola]|jgi:molecular chaperone DnaK (HSP70)|nr:Hsp70 family protein [Aetokthonos hydrillicola]MBW4590035.1 Hsp70 family protein [Aetokthonos hydrillicola CCALA 1050]